MTTLLLPIIAAALCVATALGYVAICLKAIHDDDKRPRP